MDNPGLPDPIWDVIDGRLWHVTSATGLRGIVDSGEIRITGERYPNSLCRYLNCVSLFDFGITAVDNWLEHYNWKSWFGHQQNERVAIWLEIDRQATNNNVYDAERLRHIWKCNLRHIFFSGVEAGHQGPVPIEVLQGAVLIDRDHLETFELHNVINDTLIGRVAHFEETLPPPT